MLKDKQWLDLRHEPAALQLDDKGRLHVREVVKARAVVVHLDVGHRDDVGRAVVGDADAVLEKEGKKKIPQCF